jgi:transposase
MAYSMEFRRAVAKAYDECGSSIQVAEDFGCCESWVRRLIQRRRERGGSLDPLPAKLPDNNKLDERDLEKLKRLIADTPDMTLAELAAALGGKASVPTVWRATQRLDLPLKKSPSTPLSRTAPTSGRRATRGGGGSRT